MVIGFKPTFTNEERNVEISTIQSRLFDIKMGQIFDTEIDEFLENLCTKNSFCKEFIVCPLLTGISHLMKQSSVLALVTMKEPNVFYSALVADPSTGQDTAMYLVKQSIRGIEEYENVAESRMIIKNTFEEWIDSLEKDPCRVSFYKENSAFIRSVDISDPTRFDRSFYRQIYRGPDPYNIVLTEKRYFIRKPRLNICLLGNVSEYVKFVRSEKEIENDIVHRLHICAPLPTYTVNNTKPLNFSLTVILYVIHKMNSESVNYVLDTKAKLLFGEIYSKYGYLLAQFHKQYDLFSAAICGKSASQIIRVAMFIHSFRKAFRIISKLSKLMEAGIQINLHQITPQLESILNKLVKEKSYFNTISEESLSKAYNLVQYFHKNKLVFAGFSGLDFDQDIIVIMESILNNISNDHKPSFSVSFRIVASIILLYPGTACTAYEIKQKLSNSYSIDDVINAFVELEKLKLGRVTNSSNTMFTKLTREEVENNSNAKSVLESLGIDLDSYFKTCSNDISLTSQRVRPNDENKTNSVNIENVKSESSTLLEDCIVKTLLDEIRKDINESE